MKERLKQFIKKYEMIKQGETVSVGLSGGADSVCLFLLLFDLKDELGFSLEAFHVNHKLRGEDSEADMEYVRRLCSERNIPLRIFEHDVTAAAERMKCGTEEAGRLLRREDAKVCISEGADKIALAHHKNDQAETVLFNLCRGTSVTGLCGIRPVNGAVIHPLLIFEKEELEKELLSRGIGWCTDKTNADTNYTRNALRHLVVPVLEENVNLGTVDHISTSAFDMLNVLELIKSETSKAKEKYTVFSPESVLIAKGLLNENPIIRGAVIKECIYKLAGKERDLGRIHIETVEDLLKGENGRSANICFGLKVRKTYKGTVIEKGETESISDEVLFEPEKEIRFSGHIINSEICSNMEYMSFEKNCYTKMFDYDIIKKGCVIRTRRKGDRLVIDENGSTKKLKDIFIDEKIDREERDRIPLLAKGSTVYWIIGYRMGESAKITKNTKKAVKIIVSGE